MKQTALIIQLAFNGRIVGEISSKDLKSDITIGRSEKCDWRIPAEDRGVSGVHARLFLSGKKIMIEDMKSRNGIYFMGNKIQKRRIVAGDVYSIGDCKLTVEYDLRDQKNNKALEKYHKLEQLSGQDRGKVFSLKEDHIKIGAAPECSIVLNDSLVSKLHAVLENHPDGTCWVKDMGSRNGTKVNGTLLNEENAETGRMLKDGDIISIAYIDFRFWDRTVVHIRSHLFLKIGVVAATLAIVLGGYFTFQLLFPSAKAIRLEAEKIAATGDFEGAKVRLQDATTARGADSDAPQRLDLARKLVIWQETYETWEEIKELLSGTPGSRKLVQANSLFGSIISADKERWQWNIATATAKMKEAQETHLLLSTLLGIEDRISLAGDDIAYLQENRTTLKNALETCRKNSQTYQTAIQAEAADLLEEIDFQISEEAKIQQIISTCTDMTRLDDTITGLETIRDRASARIEQREKGKKKFSRNAETMCKKRLEVLQKLLGSRNILDDNIRSVSKLNFESIKDELHLPPEDECKIAPNFSMCRKEMEDDGEILGRIVIQLKNFKSSLDESKCGPGQQSELLTSLFDQELWKTSILACDCLNLPQPSYGDKTARSKYDRMLGIYVFWDYLRSIGEDFDTTVFDDRFKPDIFCAKDLFNALETFLTFCKPNERSLNRKVMSRLVSENGGKSALADYIASAESIIRKRDALIVWMHEYYTAHSDSRDGIIAGGAALSLLPASWTDFKTDDFQKEVRESLRMLRVELAKKNEQNMDTTPEQRMENEKAILTLGIPGDSFLKQPWSDHVPAEKQ